MQTKQFHNNYYTGYRIHKLDVTNQKIWQNGYIMACQIQNTEFRNSRVECIK